MANKILVNTGSEDGLLTDGTKSLHTNVNLLSNVLFGIHLKAVLQEVLMSLIQECSKIIF